MGQNFWRISKAEIRMSKHPENGSSRDGRPAGLASSDGNRGDELVAQADRMLARYRPDVREQITDLVRVLAAKPGEAEIRTRG
jgi:hypothetical protein